jgi:hypothetical protein
MSKRSRRCWTDREVDDAVVRPLGPTFPGLAEPSTAAAELNGAFDIVNQRMGWQDVAGRQILLVPCNRPADALGVIAWQGQRLSCAEICATLRSWEERFAAIPVALDAWGATLLIGSPPTMRDQALRLAAELAAITTVEDMHEDGDLQRLAEALLSSPEPTRAAGHGEFTSRHWRLNVDD